MNSNNNEFTLNFSHDGYISIIGGARVMDKDSIRSFIEKTVQQLEPALIVRLCAVHYRQEINHAES